MLLDIWMIMRHILAFIARSNDSKFKFFYSFSFFFPSNRLEKAVLSVF
jgi:hypothetical protein